MAVMRIIEAGVTPEEYDQVRERLGMGDDAPPGARLHVAGVGEDGRVRIVELWDSREDADAFTERVRSARQELGVGEGPPAIEYFDVHRQAEA